VTGVGPPEAAIPRSRRRGSQNCPFNSDAIEASVGRTCFESVVTPGAPRTYRSPLVAEMAKWGELVGAVMLARRRDHDPVLLDRALRGELTRGNTRPGTPKRQAVDRITYLRRRERHPQLTARQALGHPSPRDVAPRISLMVEDPPRFVILEGLNRADLRRAGRYDHYVQQLDTGRITGASFQRRIRTWRLIAGFRFLADPEAVLAILENLRATDHEVFVYESGRAA